VVSNAGDEGRPEIDTTVPHSARIWNYWLGGKDNYAVDRQAGEQTIAVLPEIVDVARASRQFLVRVVRYLAADAGIRQFLDIGTGLPTVNNTHGVAQQVAPDSRVVYVVAAFLEGLELIGPGVVPCPRWRPEPSDIGTVQDMDEFCALGRK
jgi:S-adenosyl methyltransferase